MTSTIPAESGSKITGVKSAKKALGRAGGLGADIAAALKTEPVTLPASTARQIVRLPVALILDSPDNPRQDVEEDVTGLAASMEASGLLQPVLVAPAALYRAGSGQIPDSADDGRYVLIAGHRRTFAARSLGWTHIDAIVEDTRVGLEARKAMIIENFQRVDLTPLEEARAFAELAELGVKQEEVAEQVGCSQSHISKRLALLKLDEQVQAAVAQKSIPLTDALELGKLKEPARQRAALKAVIEPNRWGDTSTAEEAVEEQLAQQKRDENAAKSRAALAAASLEEVQGLQSLFGNDYWSYRLYDGPELKKHRDKKLDCLVGHVDEHRGEINYYCKAKKRCAAYPSRQAGPSKEVLEERSRKAAMKRRRDHAAQLAQHPLGTTELQTFLVEHYVGLTGLSTDADARSLAVDWFLAAGHGGLEGVTHWQIAQRLDEHPDRDKLLRLYAAALRVAGMELHVWYKHRRWDQTAATYLRELAQKTGYEPDAWERNKLKTEAGIKDVDAFLGSVTASAGGTA